MYKPLVSIIIPVYNGTNYLAEAINSALAQTYNNIEIIVVNDGSTDNGETEKLALGYNDKIRYIKKENGGSSSALNVGIDNMKGDWFSWLSHDDLYYPNKIEKQIELLNNLVIQKTDIDIKKQVVVCASEVIGSNGEILFKQNNKKIKKTLEKVNDMSNVEMIIEMLHKISFHGCGFLLPKECFDRVGKFDEELRLLNDVEYWFRLLSNEYKFTYIPEILVSGRMHKSQISHAIGFSYNNDEQAQYWDNIISWIYSEKNNHKAKIFYKIGKYARYKKRDVDAIKAYYYAKQLSKTYKYLIPFTDAYIFTYRFIRSCARKLYIKIKL